MDSITAIEKSVTNYAFSSGIKITCKDGASMDSDEWWLTDWQGMCGTLRRSATATECTPCW